MLIRQSHHVHKIHRLKQMEQSIGFTKEEEILHAATARGRYWLVVGLEAAL